MYRPNQTVRVKRLVGPYFEPDWKEKATIARPRAINLPMPGPDWYLVRFDDGGKLCIHASNLMADNA
jgi:hypothetical protein